MGWTWAAELSSCCCCCRRAAARGGEGRKRWGHGVLDKLCGHATGQRMLWRGRPFVYLNQEKKKFNYHELKCVTKKKLKKKMLWATPVRYFLGVMPLNFCRIWREYTLSCVIREKKDKKKNCSSGYVPHIEQLMASLAVGGCVITWIQICS